MHLVPVKLRNHPIGQELARAQLPPTLTDLLSVHSSGAGSDGAWKLFWVLPQLGTQIMAELFSCHSALTLSVAGPE